MINKIEIYLLRYVKESSTRWKLQERSIYCSMMIVTE